jgi:hypothetical protein
LIGTVPSKEDLEKVEDIALGQESVVKVMDIAALLRY